MGFGQPGVLLVGSLIAAFLWIGLFDWSVWLLCLRCVVCGCLFSALWFRWLCDMVLILFVGCLWILVGLGRLLLNGRLVVLQCGAVFGLWCLLWLFYGFA